MSVSDSYAGYTSFDAAAQSAPRRAGVSEQEERFERLGLIAGYQPSGPSRSGHFAQVVPVETTSPFKSPLKFFDHAPFPTMPEEQDASVARKSRRLFSSEPESAVASLGKPTDRKKYAVKLLKRNVDRETGTAFLVRVHHEYEVAQKMGQLEVGPRVREAAVAPRDPDTFAIVSEWCGRYTWSSFWNEHVTRPQIRLRMLQALLQKVRHMHSAGYVHLDLHGSNIVLCDGMHTTATPTGDVLPMRLYLVDYGWASDCVSGRRGCWEPAHWALVADPTRAVAPQSWEETAIFVSNVWKRRVDESGRPNDFVQHIFRAPVLADYVLLESNAVALESELRPREHVFGRPSGSEEDRRQWWNESVSLLAKIRDDIASYTPSRTPAT